jgi:hypothetical protein
VFCPHPATLGLCPGTSDGTVSGICKKLRADGTRLFRATEGGRVAPALRRGGARVVRPALKPAVKAGGAGSLMRTRLRTPIPC